jgi:hypothetical protein
MDGQRWAQHGLNLAAHCLLCLAAYGTGQRLLRYFRMTGVAGQEKTAALLGALLLACHPLGVEAVNLVQALGMQLAALFVTCAVGQLLPLLDRPSWRGVAALCACSLLAMLSSPSGTPMVLGALGLVLLACRGGGVRRLGRLSFRPSSLRVMAAVGVGAFAAYAAYFWKRIATSHLAAEGGQWQAHVLTQSRLFWEYLRQMVFPQGQCVNPQTAWTVGWNDLAALGALAALVVVLAVALRLTVWGKPGAMRGAGLLGLLMAAPLMLRFCYVHPQAFSELRAYPSLPWACLLAGVGISLAGSRFRLAAPLLGSALVGCLALFTWQYSSKWQSAEILAQDFVQKQPLSLQARVCLQQQQFARGQFTAVLRSRTPVFDAYKRLLEYNVTNNKNRLYNLEEAFAWRVESERLVTLALAENFGPHYALAYADKSLELLTVDANRLAALRGVQQNDAASPVQRARALIARNATAMNRRSSAAAAEKITDLPPPETGTR